jgi:hypothetical protein
MMSALNRPSEKFIFITKGFNHQGRWDVEIIDL